MHESEQYSQEHLMRNLSFRSFCPYEIEVMFYLSRVLILLDEFRLTPCNLDSLLGGTLKHYPSHHYSIYILFSMH